MAIAYLLSNHLLLPLISNPRLLSREGGRVLGPTTKPDRVPSFPYLSFSLSIPGK
jgi:hypothetical protein